MSNYIQSGSVLIDVKSGAVSGTVAGNLIMLSGGGGGTGILGDGTQFDGQYFVKTFNTYTYTVTPLLPPYMHTINGYSIDFQNNTNAAYPEATLLTKTSWSNDEYKNPYNNYASSLESHDSSLASDVKNGLCAALVFSYGGSTITEAYRVDLNTEITFELEARTYFCGTYYWTVKVNFTSSDSVYNNEVYNYGQADTQYSGVLKTSMSYIWSHCFSNSRQELYYDSSYEKG